MRWCSIFVVFLELISPRQSNLTVLPASLGTFFFVFNFFFYPFYTSSFSSPSRPLNSHRQGHCRQERKLSHFPLPRRKGEGGGGEKEMRTIGTLALCFHVTNDLAEETSSQFALDTAPSFFIIAVAQKEGCDRHWGVILEGIRIIQVESPLLRRFSVLRPLRAPAKLRSSPLFLGDFFSLTPSYFPVSVFLLGVLLDGSGRSLLGASGGYVLRGCALHF